MNRRHTYLALLLAGSLAVVPLAACGGKPAQDEAQPAQQEAQQEEATQPEESTKTEESTQVANPFIDCGSAYEAAQLAGFDATFPESVPGYSTRTYQAIEGKLVQCFYGTPDENVLIRKGVGEEDLSGDYNDYAVNETVTIGDLSVTERGDGTLVFVATWTREGYSYAIDADVGLDAATIEHLVQATN